jgi:chromate reductase
MHILGISGSLRKDSLNTAALHACKDLLPPDVTLSVFDLTSIPLYNEDVRAVGLPASVQQLREQIKAADALVIATPEYNYSIPGVLKNAIDWASRPPEQPFDGKPIALIGATPGGLGTSAGACGRRARVPTRTGAQSHGVARMSTAGPECCPSSPSSL